MVAHVGVRTRRLEIGGDQVAGSFIEFSSTFGQQIQRLGTVRGLDGTSRDRAFNERCTHVVSAQRVLQGLVEELGFAARIGVEHRSHSHARALGNLADGRHHVAVLDEERCGCVADGLASSPRRCNPRVCSVNALDGIRHGYEDTDNSLHRRCTDIASVLGDEMDNAQILRTVIEEGFGRGDLGVVDRFAGATVAEHEYLAPQEVSGAEKLRAMIEEARTEMPGMTMSVEDLVVDGDKVWARSVARTTHPATGAELMITVFDVCRFEGGKIVEHWGVPDRFALLHQLGALPARPTS